MRSVLREQLGVGPDPESVALYEEVLAFEGRDVPTPAERARALLAWATIHWERADLDEAERTATEVRCLAVDAGLGRELAGAGELLGLIAYARGRWQEVFAREFLATIRLTPELAPFVYDANMCMSEFALHQRDGLERLSQFADDLLTVADEADSAQASGLGLLLQGEVGLLAGSDPSGVDASLRGALRLRRATASDTGVILATERLAQLEGIRGHTAAASRLHRRAARVAARSTVATHLLPLVFGGMLERVDPAAGIRVVDEADAALSGVRACDPCSMSLHVHAAMSCARSRHLERAHTHLAEGRRIADMWSDGPWHASVNETEAVLRRAEGADDGRFRHLLASAADGFDAAGRRRDAARCRTLLGGVSRETGTLEERRLPGDGQAAIADVPDRGGVAADGVRSGGRDRAGHGSRGRQRRRGGGARGDGAGDATTTMATATMPTMRTTTMMTTATTARAPA